MAQGRSLGQQNTRIPVDTFTSKKRNVKAAPATGTTYVAQIATILAAVTHTTNPTTTPYVVQPQDDLVLFDSSGGTIGVQLPSQPELGEVHEFQNVSTSGNAVTYTTVAPPAGAGAGGVAPNMFGPGIAAATSQTLGGSQCNARFTYVGAAGWAVITKTDAA